MLVHRGRLPGFTENTVDAFVECAHLGADGVELDVRRCADGALVVIHDPMVAGLGVVADLAVGDLPGWVPLLGEALAACGTMSVNVEIKNDPSEPGFDDSGSLAMAVAEVLAGREEQVVVSCFNRPTLDAVRTENSQLPTAWLATGLDGAELNELATAGHNGVNLLHLAVTEDLVTRAHSAGLQVGAWTVDEPGRMRELAGWGVDTVITNEFLLARGVFGG